ncbi:MAG: hypothetical protein NEA02_09230, partial [Thermoanaerobaculia bacterium]|nr:hypothetical protein [Thermoanaerobaculia bacterium]
MLPRSDPAAPALIHDRAKENLRFIRETMDRSATFSAVPGVGGMAMGVLGLAAALLSARETTPHGWLLVWLAIAPLAAGVGVFFLRRKARATDTALAHGAGRRFALALVPPLLAGAALTAALVNARAFGVLPGLWLLVYGIAILAAGAHSVPAVRLFGAALLAFGFAALAAPFPAANALLGAGFGVGHVVTGAVIARRHGG